MMLMNDEVSLIPFTALEMTIKYILTAHLIGTETVRGGGGGRQAERQAGRQRRVSDTVIIPPPPPPPPDVQKYACKRRTDGRTGR